MTRRTWIVGVALLTLTATGGVWAGLAWANARTSAKAADCCLDATCPPGCSEFCLPDGTDSAEHSTKTAAKTSCCCDDPTCPPGCSPECPPDCLDLTSEAKTIKAKTYCPPCPFCP